MSNRLTDLRQSLSGYQALVATHTAICQQLREQRRGATDGAMVKLDERIEMRERAIAAFNRAIEATEWLIKTEEDELTRYPGIP